MEIATDGLGVEIEEKIDANKTENIKAFIPKEHLTDHPSMADLLLASYKVGDSIEQAICFERDVVPIMTLKPIILNDIQENECKYKFLSIKGGMSFLRHYYLLITKWHAEDSKG